MASYGTSPESHRTYRVDGSEKLVFEVLSKLRFISQIKEGCVVDTSTLTMMEIGIKTSAYRTILARGESREATLVMFNEVVSSAFELLEKYYVTSNDLFFRDIGVKLVECLQSSKEGMKNHIKTYVSDNMHTSKVKTLLDSIDMKLSDALRRVHAFPHSSRSSQPLEVYHSSQPSL